MTEDSRRAVVTAFLANLGIAVAKFAAYLATGSSSMLAESVHSVADTGNQALLFLGGARARREPTPEHPFGYGRERYFWSFVVAVVLFLLGSLFALYEGFAKLQHPHPIVSPGWAIGVLCAGLVMEGWSFRTAVHAANPLRAGQSWWGFVRHSKTPELPVVLLEDLGALLGLLFALVGVLLATTRKDPRFDAFATLAIGSLMFLIALVLAIEMKSLLIGEAASARDRLVIRDAIESSPRVRRLIHMRTLHLGPDELLVAAKLEFDADLDLAQVARAIDAVEENVRARVPLARVIYLEPDIHRGDGEPQTAAQRQVSTDSVDSLKT